MYQYPFELKFPWRGGGSITFRNKERMVMPLTYRVTFDDDTTEVLKVPVEAWFQSDVITRRMEQVKAIKQVRIDPDGMLPDIARDNNLWSADK